MNLFKQAFIAMDTDSRDPKPGFYRDALNIIPATDGLDNSGSKQTVPGSVVRTNAGLPAGSTQIGSCVDSQNNWLIYFCYCDDGINHSIWYFDPSDNTHTEILKSQYLNFSLSHPITGSYAVNGILFFTEGLNGARSFNIQQAINGLYAENDPKLAVQIALLKPAPLLSPTAEKLADAGVTSNNISSDGWQFSVRYIYHDNTYSLLSPLSKLVLPSAFPKLEDTLNYISVTIDVDSTVDAVIQRLQFCFVKNNSGDVYMFKEILATGASSYTVSFYNAEPLELLDENATTSVNMVPLNSKNLTFFKDRVFTTLDEFDYADVGDFTLTMSMENASSGDGSFHLPGCSYSYGVVFRDITGARTNGVLLPTPISFPNQYCSSNTNADPAVLRNARWTIGGNLTPPAWAKTFSIVRKLNNTMQTFVQTPAQVMFYKREGSSSGSGETLDNGKVFYNSKQPSWENTLTLRVPINIPISLDNTYKIRLLQNIGQTHDVENIIDIQGGKIICGNFGITNWSSKTAIFLVQLELYKRESEELFFEVGEDYPIEDGAFSTATGVVKGDAYRMFLNIDEPGQCFQVDDYDFGFTKDGSTTGGQMDAYPPSSPNDRWLQAKYWGATIYSMSPTTASNTIETLETTIEKPLVNKKKQRRRSIIGSVAGGVLLGGIGAVAGALLARRINKQENEETTEKIISDIRRVYTLDYSKIITSIGRSWVEVNNKQVNNEPGTIAYSEKLVANSKVNGTNLFYDVNTYSISPAYTRIRKLQPAGNVMLSIHDRATHGIYVGEGFVRTADGQDILTKTDAVIGDARVFEARYGCVHPQSVVEYNGRAWWVDAHNSELIRYNNGLTPLAMTYKMKTFFREKCSQLLTTGGNVVGGFDPNTNMVYMTFTIGEEKTTIGFVDRPNYEGFISRFSFTPEAYATISDRFFSFEDGVLLEHNASSTQNNFNGVQFDSRITAVFNDNKSKVKILKTIAEESNNVWTVPECRGVAREQITNLRKAAWFNQKNAHFYTWWLRDTTTNPLLLEGNQTALRSGKVMRDQVFEIDLKCTSTEETTIDSITIGYRISPGQRSN